MELVRPLTKMICIGILCWNILTDNKTIVLHQFRIIFMVGKSKLLRGA